MDYEVGSIADLISGNHTPNRPKVTQKPLTPVKVPPSENVTPRDWSSNKQNRTPKIAFTPEITHKVPKLKSPSTNQHDSPRSTQKNKKAKLFNFATQLSDNLESKNEKNQNSRTPFSKKINTNNNQTESFGKKNKQKKEFNEIKNEDVSNVFEESIKSLNTSNNENVTSGKKKKQKNKKNKESNNLKMENDDNNSFTSMKTSVSDKTNGEGNKSKKNKRKEKLDNSATEEFPKRNEIIISGDLEPVETPKPKRKKMKNKKQPSHEDIEDSNASKKKKRKADAKEESLEDAVSKDENDDGDSDRDDDADAILANDNAESEDDKEEMTEFQKAAQKRIEKKVLRNEKFSPEVLERTLFIGNIPISVLQKNYERILRKKFSQYGAIKSIRIRNIPVPDFNTKPKVALIEKKFHAERNNVIAYIEFENPESVEKSLVENNSILEGNHLRVDKCRQGKQVPDDSRKTIFLGNLPFNIQEETLRKMFERCGEIYSIRVVRDRQTQIGKGIAFINFTKSDGVELALSLSEEDLQIKGKVIRVQRYNTSGGKNSSKGNPNKRNFQGNRNDGRFQQFNRNQNSNQQQNYRDNNRSLGKKRDVEGKKLRKRNLEKSDDVEGSKKMRYSKQNENQDDTTKLEHNNENAEERVSGFEGKKSDEVETGKDISGGDNKQSRKEKFIEFKGLIAKKKKKFKLDKAILKKKKISKILMQPPKTVSS